MIDFQGEGLAAAAVLAVARSDDNARKRTGLCRGPGELALAGSNVRPEGRIPETRNV